MPRALLAGIAVVLVGFTTIAAMAVRAWRAPAPVVTGDGLSIALSVEPFAIGDSVPVSWNSTTFAESLASRLSGVPGLRASTTERNGHYSVQGSVAMKEGRLILAARLRKPGRDTVWTATFWRSAPASATLLSDLTAAVAEAAVNTRVQESLAAKREKK
jgi:hypothetical protein